MLFLRDPQFTGGNIEVEGKQNSLFPTGPVISVSLYISQLKNRKLNNKLNCEEIVCLTQAGSRISRGLKEHDMITCESKDQVVVSPAIDYCLP